MKGEAIKVLIVLASRPKRNANPIYELGCNKKLSLDSINLISSALKIEVQATLDIHGLDNLHFDNLLIGKFLFFISCGH